MPRRPKTKKKPTRQEEKEDSGYNFEQAERIVKALDFLREEAVKTGIPEIVTMVDATFNLMLNTYYSILRYEMQKLPGTVQ